MKKILITLLLCFIGIGVSLADVANPKPTNVKQSDGTTLTITTHGDERVHWYRTIDEYTVMINDDNDFVYAISDGVGGMKCSNIIAHNPNERSAAEENFLLSLKKRMFYSSDQVSIMTQYDKALNDFNKNSVKLKANSDGVEEFKLIVILMSFKDVVFSTPKEDIDALFNQVGYSANGHPGSVHDYFHASSNGKLNVISTVIGPYVADSNLAYYGGSHTSGSYYYGARALLREGLLQANDDIDFSQYTNGEGNEVSCIYMIYAGYPQSANPNHPELIWPHQGYMYPSMTLDGVTIQKYSCSSEYPGTYNNPSPLVIGTICHEFSHALGQPDYYDTDYELNGQAFHPGEWDIMASGNYNGNGMYPPLWHAMERNVRGYVDIEEANVDNDYTLEDLSVSGKALRLSYDNSLDWNLSKEYFILENRRTTGFDYYLPGNGMLIFKVDRNPEGWSSNCANCNTSRLGFQLVTADNSHSEYYYSEAQTFPGTTNKRSFTDNTTPSSKSFDNYNLNKPLYRITENKTTGNITFHVGDTTNFVDIYNTDIAYKNDTITAAASVKANNLSIIEKGVLYDLNNIPNSNSTKIIDNTSSTTTIGVNLTGLSANETYFIRPYVKTATNISYGESIRIKVPCPSVSVFPFVEDFSNGISDCWSEENKIYKNTNWDTNSDGEAHISTDYVMVNNYGAVKPEITLITPALNTEVLDEPILVFDHYQKPINSVSDNLIVYYKTSLESSWQLLKDFNSANISTWATDTITLPVKSNTLYIGFKASLRGKDGVYLDNVTITDKKVNSWPVVTFEGIENITDVSATFKANVFQSGYTDLINKGFVLSTNNSEPTINDIVVSTNNSSIGEFELTTNDLQSSSLYYVRAFAQNQGMISYSDVMTFATRCPKVSNFPYSADMTSTDTLCFELVGDKLILPIFDFSNQDSLSVIYKTTKNTTNADNHNISLYYRNGVEGDWELISTNPAQDNETITIAIPTLNHQNDNSYLAFEGLKISTGEYNLSDLIIKAVLQVPIVETDTAYLSDYNKIFAQGNVISQSMSEVTERGFVYSKTNSEPTTDDSKILAGSGEGVFNATINNLDTLTTYYVRSFATNNYGTTYGKTFKITTPFIPIYNNTISSDQHLCAGSVASNLIGTTPTGGNGSYTYLWITSTDSINWTPCDEGSTNDNDWYAPQQKFVTTYYKRVVYSYVSIDTSNTVTIKVDAASKGGNVFALQDNVRQNEEARFQLRAYVGDIMYWERLRPGYDWQEIENSADMIYLSDYPEDMGEYSYRAIVQSGTCNAVISGEGKVNVLQGVGLEYIDNEITLSLTPNPAKDIVYLTTNFETDKVNITVTDSKGVKVIYQNVPLHKGKNALSVDTLNEGTYIITIQNENIHINTKLVISK